MPTARDVPDTGTKASDLSDGSKGMPRMPSCTEYSRKEPTPTANTQHSLFSAQSLCCITRHVQQFLNTNLTTSGMHCVYECVVPSQDCCPVRRLYPAVHMQALVFGEVGRHSWEQSPLLLLQRFVPGNPKAQEQIHKTKSEELQ